MLTGQPPSSSGPSRPEAVTRGRDRHNGAQGAGPSGPVGPAPAWATPSGPREHRPMTPRPGLPQEPHQHHADTPRITFPGRGRVPNLLQRRPAAGSAASGGAQYQRFSSGAPGRSGPLQQIRTNDAASPWEGSRGPGDDHGDHGGHPVRPRRPLRRPRRPRGSAAVGPARKRPGSRERHLTGSSHLRVW